MIKIQVSKTLQRKIRQGYPWVFHYQVQNKNVRGEPGDLGVIYDSDNNFLALGLYDPFSDIRLRILQTLNPAEIGPEFFRTRLRKSVELREPLRADGKTTGYRVINGENDGFPGLILDRYEDTAVLKLYTSAWVPFLETLLPLFRNETAVERCVLKLSRNTMEAVEEKSGFRNGQVMFGAELSSPVRFKENGLLFDADVINGSKTGFFLDQRDNRKHIGSMSKGKSVLNVFSYSGAFSVYAFAGGCRSVLEIDSNKHALDTARESLKVNFSGRQFKEQEFGQLCGDAFDLLSALQEKNDKFDLVLLDPPAFAQKKGQKAGALKAYRRLTELGVKLTCQGGTLFVSSCSAHVPPVDFYEAVLSGVGATGRDWEEILRTGHAMDHPVSFSEGRYLKGVYLAI